MMKRRLLKMAVGMCLMLILAIAVSATVLAAPPQVVEITVNDHNPEQTGPAQVIAYWAQKVNELGQGRIKMTVRHGGELLMGHEEYRGTQKGAVVDASYYVLDPRDGFLLNSIMTLPFMGWPDQEKAGQIYAQLMKKFPQVRGEFKAVIPYVFSMMPPTHIHNNKREIKTPADLKGLTIHSAESGLVQALEVAGATVVQLDITDMSTGLERGIVDGVVNHFPVLFVFNVLQLMPFHTIFGKGGVNMTPMGIIWNEKKWNSYPPDVKKILTDGTHFYTEKFYEMDYGMQDMTIKFCKDRNHTFTNLTPQEIKVWYDLVKKPIHDRWIAEAEAKGLPGRAVYNEALRLIQKQK
jgi:TRAP-type C4-dicarboxylate transport system substrate-binding protein